MSYLRLRDKTLNGLLTAYCTAATDALGLSGTGLSVDLEFYTEDDGDGLTGVFAFRACYRSQCAQHGDDEDDSCETCRSIHQGHDDTGGMYRFEDGETLDDALNNVFEEAPRWREKAHQELGVTIGVPKGGKTEHP